MTMVEVITSGGLQSTASEMLNSDVLRVECAKRVITGPNQATRLNISVYNNSSCGRMARVGATYNQTQVNVIIQNPLVYVAPNGMTTIQAILQPLVAEGTTNVKFTVH